MVTSNSSDVQRTGHFFDVYRQAAGGNGERRLNPHVHAPVLAFTRLVYVADSDAEARRDVRDWYFTYARNINHQWLAHGDRRLAHLLDVDEPADSEVLLAGSPETVASWLQHFVDHTGATGFFGTFTFGSMPEEASRQSLHRFAADVMPAVRAATGASASRTTGHAAAAEYHKVDIV
jgi:alkanesulfonate monooxygenase SsuD/methylene tetrahydromethanopterin reductase-like flavin-dependent oxidoreductase (luciferase family)